MNSKKELYTLYVNTFPETWFMAVDGKVSEKTAQMILDYIKKGYKVKWSLMRDETAALQAAEEAKKRCKTYTFEEYMEMIKNKNKNKNGGMSNNEK